MKTYADFFKDKTVTLLGLGLLGRGVGDAAFLAQHCKKLIVTDMKNSNDLRTSLDILTRYENIEFVLGHHDTKDFENVDFVVKGAGVRLDNPYIFHAQKNDIPVYMSTALFVHLSSIKTIGVTGTRGKTTTTCMIAEILKHAGKKVLLGGNIRGVSTLALLPEASSYDVAVLELDSWQLQGFDNLQISPNISIFTNLYADHMNYYDGNMERYLHDKTAIFRHQKEGDVLVTTEEVKELSKKECDASSCRSKWILVEPLPSSFKLKLPGAHNLINASLAEAAALAYGVDKKIADQALHDFEAIEGRLQPIGEWNGRHFYNDSNSTTQDATLAALTSFPAREVILIFGGSDKGLPIDRMLDYISSNNIRSVLIKGTGSDRVLQKLPQLNVVGSMKEAVSFATGLSKDGDHILLSPAFASFGIFKNEYDRSDQFVELVRGLISKGAV